MQHKLHLLTADVKGTSDGRQCFGIKLGGELDC